MNVLICPDTFKGTLSAREAALAIERGILGFPGVHTAIVPMADGGYGTLDAISGSAAHEIVNVEVRGPLGRKVNARYIILYGDTAFIEMAEAAGLVLVPEGMRDPMLATTYGVGELMLDALKKGCSTIYIGLGGSATNDGGMGMAQALGVRFLDREGKEVSFRRQEGYSGGSLKFIAGIDMSHMSQLARKASFFIASDVKNPLFGKHGASHVYGPQKGATPEMIAELDSSLENYALLIKRDVGRDVIMPGAGAAGGLGAGLVGFLDAKIVSGVEVVMELVGLEGHVQKSDLIITGEGRIDNQTVQGKTISGIARAASRHNVPVIAIGGCLGKGYEDVLGIGVALVQDASEGRKYDMDTLKKQAAFLLQKAARIAFEKYLGGMKNET